MAIPADIIEQNVTPSEDQELRVMMEAGVHLGHSKNKRHPAMQPYILMVRNGISVIDLIKTKEKLVEALLFLRSVAAKGGIVLFVGTRPAAKKILEEVGKELDMPYVIGRWIGGTLTNFKVIIKRIELLMTMEDQRRKGEFEKYTKKEQMRLGQEIDRLHASFNGLRALTRLPDALFVVNIDEDEIAVREARRMRIPVVALADTNVDPDAVSHPIPSNDDAIPSVRYMAHRAAEAIKEGRADARAEAEKEKEKV